TARQNLCGSLQAHHAPKAPHEFQRQNHLQVYYGQVFKSIIFQLRFLYLPFVPASVEFCLTATQQARVAGCQVFSLAQGHVA
ncbi:MAG: hypothetical protein KGJ80_12280, partial [Chloroflexota bacterium]|nr:hypothetical protein [Chloroflexota bacterium]